MKMVSSSDEIRHKYHIILDNDHGSSGLIRLEQFSGES